MSHPPCHCANVCAICEAARACGPDEDAAASVGVSCVPGAGERIHLFPQPSDNNSSIHQPSDGDRQCKLNRNRYCLLYTGCSLNIVFLSKNSRKFATSPSPALGCYWSYKKLPANRSDCTIALSWEL